MFKVGDKVFNVRRPGKTGVVLSLDAPNNKWCTRPQDFRITVKYKELTRKSNGKWASGILDELPIDLLHYGEDIHEAYLDRASKSTITHIKTYGSK
jgi:hypothetical protein